MSNGIALKDYFHKGAGAATRPVGAGSLPNAGCVMRDTSRPEETVFFYRLHGHPNSRVIVDPETSIPYTDRRKNSEKKPEVPPVHMAFPGGSLTIEGPNKIPTWREAFGGLDKQIVVRTQITDKSKSDAASQGNGDVNRSRIGKSNFGTPSGM